MQNAQPKPVPPPEFEAGRIDALGEPELIALLKNPKSTEFEKAKACQRLANIGTAAAVPALATLLADPHLNTYARYGLQPIPDPSATAALLSAIPKLNGSLLIGVINSLGHRQDPQAVGALTLLLSSPDPDSIKAAAAALGHIGSLESAKTLKASFARSQPPLRAAFADAALICAERLLGRGERQAALDLYNVLTAADVPKPARLAAMHGIIAAETSLARPREVLKP